MVTQTKPEVQITPGYCEHGLLQGVHVGVTQADGTLEWDWVPFPTLVSVANANPDVACSGC